MKNWDFTIIIPLFFEMVAELMIGLATLDGDDPWNPIPIIPVMQPKLFLLVCINLYSDEVKLVSL